VVQSDDLPLSTWVIAPTSTGRREASFCPKIEVDSTLPRVMVEQLTVIDPQTRLGDFAGRLSSSEVQGGRPRTAGGAGTGLNDRTLQASGGMAGIGRRCPVATMPTRIAA